jgi:hypothetical protein
MRRVLERSYQIDLQTVRLHTDGKAHDAARQVSARAFTIGTDIFLGPGERPNDLRLIAHEAAHVVQQRSGPAVQRWSFDRGDRFEREADHAAQAATQQQAFAVRERTAGPRVQRLGISDALNYFADKANLIPGFRMFTIVLGVNPVNMSRVERSAANILRALIEFIPGGYLVTQALDNHGIFNKVGNWVQEQINSLGMVGSAVKQAVTDFLESLSWTDIFDLGGVWARAKRIFTDPIDRIINFAQGLITGIITFIKDAILMPLARLAEGTRGWDLLIAVLGRNPITGEAVPRTAATLIGGFMKLIGQEEVWQNIQRANAIPRAWAWFQGALAALMGFVAQIPTLAMNAFRSLELADIILVPRAFAKVAAVFGNFIGSFISWAGNAVWNLLEIIFAVVAPSVMPYLRKAAAAFRTILRNPIGFVGNLVRAGKQGFQKFAGNFLNHLKAALINWITGPLGEAGVYIPKSFSLIEIVKLVLSVLGLTWQNIRAKLTRIIPEPVLVALEKTAAILVTLIREGPAAAWEQIIAELNQLKDQLISQVTQMITSEVVKIAVARLVSMLTPAGAFVQAILAIYNTITFFIQRLRQIAAVVASFIDSIAAIAAGQIAGAANKVEQTLARLLSLVIAFLAKFAGLGNIPEKVVGVIRKIRAPIDRGLDKIVAWLGSVLQRFVGALKAGVKRLLNWWTKQKPVGGDTEPHTLTFSGSNKNARLVIRSAPELPSAFLRRTADSRSIAAKDRAAPIATTETQEKAIGKTQDELKKVDDNDQKAATGKAADEADKLMKTLDTQLGTLSTHLTTTLTAWGSKDEEVKAFSLERGSFSIEQKRAVAAQHADKSQLRLNADNELVNLQKGLARRHVVSSADMSAHYSTVLVKKKWSQAKLLLEQRGSIGAAHTPVKTPLSQNAIVEAATARYQKFFGYAKNLFIGDSRENSSIQQHLDAGHPDMAGALLYDHVRRIKRSWAIDDTFKETPVKTTTP